MLQLNDYQLTRLYDDYPVNPRAVTESLAQMGSGSCSDILSELPSRLQGYRPVNLLDLSQAKLMHRVDTKYIIPFSFLSEILEQLQPYYSILEIDGLRIFSYQTTYFDTGKLRFYHMHHNGQRPRFKVRHRRYVETDASYLEVKVKTNKNKTSKKRIKTSQHHPDTGEIQAFSGQHLSAGIQGISPSLRVDFNRITLVNESSAERLTLDTCVQFQLPNSKPPLRLSPVVIAELKKDRECKPGSAFASLLRRRNVRSSSFSKYCVGCSLLYKDKVKANMFKPIFMKLYKIYRKEQLSL